MHLLLHSHLQARPEGIHPDQFHFRPHCQGQAVVDRLPLTMQAPRSFEMSLPVYQSRVTSQNIQLRSKDSQVKT